MKQFVLILIIISLSYSVFAQKYMTQSATIKFFSETPMENIEAVNNQVATVINPENGELAYSLLIKAFVFEKALMQEHFNEKYMESETYPKSTFKGEIVDFDIDDLSKEPKTYKVSGKLTIHGVTKEIETMAQLSKVGEKIKAKTNFSVAVADYDIKIPATVRDNIAKTIDIKVDAEYEKMGG